MGNQNRDERSTGDRKGESSRMAPAGTSDEAMLKLLYYAETGSTRRRLRALSKCASILARLHSAGLVYGDIAK